MEINEYKAGDNVEVLINNPRNNNGWCMRRFACRNFQINYNHL